MAEGARAGRAGVCSQQTVPRLSGTGVGDATWTPEPLQQAICGEWPTGAYLTKLWPQGRGTLYAGTVYTILMQHLAPRLELRDRID